MKIRSKIGMGMAWVRECRVASYRGQQRKGSPKDFGDDEATRCRYRSWEPGSRLRAIVIGCDIAGAVGAHCRHSTGMALSHATERRVVNCQPAGYLSSNGSQRRPWILGPFMTFVS